MSARRPVCQVFLPGLKLVHIQIFNNIIKLATLLNPLCSVSRHNVSSSIALCSSGRLCIRHSFELRVSFNDNTSLKSTKIAIFSVNLEVFAHEKYQELCDFGYRKQRKSCNFDCFFWRSLLTEINELYLIFSGLKEVRASTRGVCQQTKAVARVVRSRGKQIRSDENFYIPKKQRHNKTA